MANNREANRLAARNLIEKGKKQGSLSLDEIMGAFSNTELDKDKVENLYETLGNLGIEILESKPEKVTIDFSSDDDLTLDMDNISLNSINTYDSKNVDEIIKNVKRNKFHKEVEALLQKQKELETSLNHSSLDKDSMKEVELEIMKISLKIVDIQKSLKNL